jgi:hypothetical protein
VQLHSVDLGIFASKAEAWIAVVGPCLELFRSGARASGAEYDSRYEGFVGVQAQHVVPF